MDLWTEFEGATIDRAFALTKLLQTEGRSAFFSTLNAQGESVLIRLIECHFDEDEILARWRGVQTLGHPNFLGIDRFGRFLIEGDDITAVYVVFERVDANLGEVLERGRLSAAEATQIGLSVASALETLHANGFVHEHVEARNIFAVGETVKLRSDCIRETPEGEAGEAARRRDAHDLGALLADVLQGARGGVAAARAGALPAPFDAIVRNAMNGTCGVAEINAALGRREVGKAPAHKATLAKGAQAAPQAERRSSVVPNARAAEGVSRKRAGLAELPVIFGLSEQDFRKWVAAGVLLLAVVVFGWVVLHRWFGHGAGAAPVSTQAAGPSQAAHAPATALPSGSAPAARSAGRMEWRVVAFTYNREDQAQKKVVALAHQFPSLWPAVFSPTGKAPWLVTIGGVLPREEAYALARKARGLGLPHDTYAQDYGGKADSLREEKQRQQS